MRSRSFASALAFAGLVLVLVGCGGGKVSDAKFRSTVDGICKRSSQELAAIPPPPPSDLAANGRYTGQVVVVVRKTHGKLKAVEAPSAKRADYKEWVSAIDQLGRVIARQSAAAAAKSPGSFNALVQEENTVLQQSKAKAALLGFMQCSK